MQKCDFLVISCEGANFELNLLENDAENEPLNRQLVCASISKS